MNISTRGKDSLEQAIKKGVFPCEFFLLGSSFLFSKKRTISDFLHLVAVCSNVSCFLFIIYKSGRFFIESRSSLYIICSASANKIGLLQKEITR